MWNQTTSYARLRQYYHVACNFMGIYHLIFQDPFVSSRNFATTIAEVFGMKYLDIGHLFGHLIGVEQPSLNMQLDQGKVEYYTLFENIVLSKLDTNGLIIPSYPRFLENFR